LGLTTPATLTPYYLLLSVKAPAILTDCLLIVQLRSLPVNTYLHFELFDYCNCLLVVKLNSGGKVMVRTSVFENSASAENIISYSVTFIGSGLTALNYKFWSLAGINSENNFATGCVVPLSTRYPSGIRNSMTTGCLTLIYATGFLIQSIVKE
jgi:hypothetical protein